MTDVLTPEQRRRCMSRIRNRNTLPELALRKRLWAAGMRFRLKYPLTGKPDLVFVGARVAVFVDGCFWHGCPEHGQIPKTNTEFWAAKIARNRARDSLVNAQLAEQGWRVLRFWQHQIKSDMDGCVQLIREALAEARPVKNISGMVEEPADAGEENT